MSELRSALIKEFEKGLNERLTAKTAEVDTYRASWKEATSLEDPIEISIGEKKITTLGDLFKMVFPSPDGGGATFSLAGGLDTVFIQTINDQGEKAKSLYKTLKKNQSAKNSLDLLEKNVKIGAEGWLDNFYSSLLTKIAEAGVKFSEIKDADEFEETIDVLDLVVPSFVKIGQLFEVVKEMQAAPAKEEKPATAINEEPNVIASEQTVNSPINPTETSTSPQPTASTLNPGSEKSEAPEKVESSSGTVAASSPEIPKEAEVPTEPVTINLSQEKPVQSNVSPTGGELSSPISESNVSPTGGALSSPISESNVIENKSSIQETETNVENNTVSSTTINEMSSGLSSGDQRLIEKYLGNDFLTSLGVTSASPEEKTELGENATTLTSSETSLNVSESAASPGDETVINDKSEEKTSSGLSREDERLVSKYLGEDFLASTGKETIETKKSAEENYAINSNEAVSTSEATAASNLTSNEVYESRTEEVSARTESTNASLPKEEMTVTKVEPTFEEKIVSNATAYPEKTVLSQPETNSVTTTPIGPEASSSEQVQPAAAPTETAAASAVAQSPPVDLSVLEKRLHRLEMILSNPLEVKIVE